jgi:hypothetical protein
MQTTRYITQLFSALTLLVILAVNSFAGSTPVNAGVSDQKAGSVLVFPYYNSKSGSDARLSISNVGATKTRVHLFFTDSTCSQSDLQVCLTANASITFKASEMDPENTGYLIAVAVDEAGRPLAQNGLIGNAFLTDGSYTGNYGAEAFWAYGNSAQMATIDMAAMEATLNFNTVDCVGTGLDALPSQFVAEIQSPNESTGQKIVTVGLTGSLTSGRASTGADQVSVGVAYNDLEKARSFTGVWAGTCQKNLLIDVKTPRIPGGLGAVAGSTANTALIPAGRTGTLKWSVVGAVGLIMTPTLATNKWSGIRNLHKISVAPGKLVIPVYPANCDAGFNQAP